MSDKELTLIDLFGNQGDDDFVEETAIDKEENDDSPEAEESKEDSKIETETRDEDEDPFGEEEEGPDESESLNSDEKLEVKNEEGKQQEEEGEIQLSLVADTELSSKNLPLFVYGGQQEAIKNVKMSFEELRKEKAKDFSELEKKEKVSWSVEYGFTKQITDTSKTIAEIKAEMEKDKQFAAAIKKSKKPITMQVKPKVMGQTKGAFGHILECPSFVGSNKLEKIKATYRMHPTLFSILQELYENGVVQMYDSERANLLKIMLEYEGFNVKELRKGA